MLRIDLANLTPETAALLVDILVNSDNNQSAQPVDLYSGDHPICNPYQYGGPNIYIDSSLLRISQDKLKFAVVGPEVASGGFASVQRSDATVSVKDAGDQYDLEYKTKSSDKKRIAKKFEGYSVDFNGMGSASHESNMMNLLKDVYHPKHVVSPANTTTKYLLSRYFEGVTLEHAISEIRTKPIELKLRIMRALFKALSYIHNKDVVHRDLKQANIIINNVDENPEIKIIDFGGAVKADAGICSQESATPIHFAPEIWNGEAATKYSDIYALGYIALSMIFEDDMLYFAEDFEQQIVFSNVLSNAVKIFFNFTDIHGDLRVKLQGLLSQMTNPEPASRLNIDECIKQIDDLICTTRSNKVSSQASVTPAQCAVTVAAEESGATISAQAKHTKIGTPLESKSVVFSVPKTRISSFFQSCPNLNQVSHTMAGSQDSPKP